MAFQPTKRSDYSHSLVHLTRKRRNVRGKLEATAYQVLTEILQNQTIRAGSGYVKSQTSVVCLSEIPLAALHHFTKPPTESAKYEPFGIVFHKQDIFDQGGRPVIYLLNNELDWIPDKHRWRVVRFEAGGD